MHFADLAPVRAQDHPAVVIAGGGLVGLTAALDLTRHVVRVRVLDDDNTVRAGSRASCFAKRTLEIFGRLGLGARFLENVVIWNRAASSMVSARATASTCCQRRATITPPP